LADIHISKCANVQIISIPRGESPCAVRTDALLNRLFVLIVDSINC